MVWLTVAEIFAIALILALLAALVILFLRRRWLSRNDHVFDCELRVLGGARPRVWTSGYARYQRGLLAWYRVFSLSFRPAHLLVRRGAQVVGQRHPDSAEAINLFAGHVVVQLRTRSTAGVNAVWELSMSPASATGLMSWLEAAPPSEWEAGQ